MLLETEFQSIQEGRFFERESLQIAAPEQQVCTQENAEEQPEDVCA